MYFIEKTAEFDKWLRKLKDLKGTTKNLTPASSALRADPLGKRFSLGHSTLLLSQLPLGSFLSSRLD